MATIYVKEKDTLPDRKPFDFYRTPPSLAFAALSRVSYNIPNVKTILDPGCGDGVWGIQARRLWPNAEITGCDIQQFDKPAEYDNWHMGYDFTDFPTMYDSFDLVIGNPPFRDAQSFVKNSVNMLTAKGSVVFLLKLAFLETETRWRELYTTEAYRPTKVYVSTRRVSFTGDGKTNADSYGVYQWHSPARRGLTFDGAKKFNHTILDWLRWKYDEE